MKLHEVTKGMSYYRKRYGYEDINVSDIDLLANALDELFSGFETQDPGRIAEEFVRLMNSIGKTTLRNRQAREWINEFKQRFQKEFDMTIEQALEYEDYGLPDDAWYPEDK